MRKSNLVIAKQLVSLAKSIIKADIPPGAAEKMGLPEKHFEEKIKKGIKEFDNFVGNYSGMVFHIMLRVFTENMPEIKDNDKHAQLFGKLKAVLKELNEAETEAIKKDWNM
jgi:hypothetical protein